jgi:hypothetical protein
MILFLSRMFSEVDQPFIGQKTEKKTLLQKLVGSPWIHPYIVQRKNGLSGLQATHL